MPTFLEFEAAERAAGFDTVRVRDWAPATELDSHRHPFAASALVVAGEMWLTVDGDTRRLIAGDRFELAADVPHRERYGAEGATFWVARRGAA